MSCAYCGNKTREMYRDHVLPQVIWRNTKFYRQQYSTNAPIVPQCQACKISKDTLDQKMGVAVKCNYRGDEVLDTLWKELLNSVKKAKEPWKAEMELRILFQNPTLLVPGQYEPFVHQMSMPKSWISIEEASEWYRTISRGLYFFCNKEYLNPDEWSTKNNVYHINGRESFKMLAQTVNIMEGLLPLESVYKGCSWISCKTDDNNGYITCFSILESLAFIEVGVRNDQDGL